MDYTLMRRTVVSPSALGSLPEWDLFVSAFNTSSRVRAVFDAVRAKRKEWLVHPEYEFDSAVVPQTPGTYMLDTRDEAEFWHMYTKLARLSDLPKGSRVCIDCTGFMRPHLMLWPKIMRALGFGRLDVLYTDPQAYEAGEKTPFAKGAVTEVRQVRGFEGNHEPDSGEEDVLVIGAGYDDELIRRVAEHKRAARKIEMFGLPSLQPHMYEENRLRAARAEEAIGPLPSSSFLFAPANDPFETAQQLHEQLAKERAERSVKNLYLSPLATKAQALGFGLYYLCECVGTAASVIFPYAEAYSQETSVGVARVWWYEIELDWFMA